jgi:hypothetical protein
MLDSVFAFQESVIPGAKVTVARKRPMANARDKAKRTTVSTIILIASIMPPIAIDEIRVAVSQACNRLVAGRFFR